jgi:PAS domain S-box-containing protein
VDPIASAQHKIGERVARRKVVLADSDADKRNYVWWLLASQYEVFTAEDGNEALRLIDEQKPDLVLTAPEMPRLDGYGLLQALRSNSRTVSIPVIMLSSRPGGQSIAENSEAGADDYLENPFSSRELLARVSGALALAKVRGEARRHEEELKAETANILESIDEAFIAVDAGWRMTWWNVQAEHIHSRGREELLGKTLWEAFPDTLGTEYERQYRRAMTARVPVRFEAPYRPIGKWYEVNGCPLPGGGLALYFHDVTDKRKYEILLSGQKQALELAVNGSPLEAVFEVLVRTIEIHSDNRAVASIHTLDSDGRHLRHGAAPSLPESYNRAIDGIEIGPSVVSAGASAYLARPVVVTDIATDPLWENFRGLALDHGLRACWSTPIFSSTGRVLGTFAIYYRETSEPDPRHREVVALLSHTAAVIIERHVETQERLIAVKALRESEEKFRNLADSISQFAWMTDENGASTWYNQRWFAYTGTTFAEMQGWGWRKLLHPDHLERVLANLKHSLETGEAWEDTFPLRGRNGEWRWFLARALPVRDAEGRIRRWCGTHTDITEQLKVEEELRRANQDLEQFAYSASHDLQEPIRNVSIFGELLRTRYGENLDEEGLQYLQFMTDGARRMGMLVKDLLAYTQTFAAPDDPITLTDSASALAKALSNLSEKIRETGARVLNGELPRIRMREVHLQQLFQNLISNAIKYRGEEPPLIAISAGRVGEYWRFAIEDNGIGISPEYRDKIFGIFKRLHGGDRYSGTGIGLAICQRLVERYGGKIWVESETGKGSTFYFTVPSAGDGEVPDSMRQES